MCIRALQIGLAIPGIWLIYAGGLPDILLDLQLKKRFPLRMDQGKLFGLMLIAPFPVSLMAAFILQMIFPEDGLTYAIIAETVITILITLMALIIARIIHKPIDDVPEDLFPDV